MQHPRQQLSAYMQPKQCCAIAQLPLSYSGKVDVRQTVTTVRNTTPASGSEWLGDAVVRYSVRACVGRALEQTEFDDNENLYVLGLDSIKSTQIAAQLRHHGWTMSAVQVMGCRTANAICEPLASHTTVSQLVQYVHNTRIDLPVLRWLTQLVLPVPSAYNHVIVLKVLSGCPLEQLHNRPHTLIQQQPALYDALDVEGWLLVCDPNVCYPNEVLTEYSTAQWTLVEVIAQCNSMLDVTNGRIFTAALLHVPQSASSMLALCTHHLCADMHSWYLILGTLDAVSTVNGTSNSGLHCWNDYLASKTVDSATYESWCTVYQTLPLHFPPVSLPDDSLSRTRAWREDFRHPCVRRLFESSSNTVYSVEIYVLMVLVLVLRYYGEEPWCRIEMEGMGRGCWPDEPDAADTVGWFTLLYPWAIPLHGDMATLLSATASDLAKRTHGGRDYGLPQMWHTSEDSLAQGIRMNYIGVQVQSSLRYLHIDHFNSDVYTAPENAPGCVLESNIACSAADGPSFHCRFDPTHIAPNDVQLPLARHKNSLTDLDAWLCQHSATLAGAPTLWAL